MSMAVGTSGGPKSDINMTPMIDVLLVLIIIFMVITPLTPKGLEALVPHRPRRVPASGPTSRTVVISINEDNSMMINQDPIEEWPAGQAWWISSRRAPNASYSLKAIRTWNSIG